MSATNVDVKLPHVLMTETRLGNAKLQECGTKMRRFILFSLLAKIKPSNFVVFFCPRYQFTYQ